MNWPGKTLSNLSTKMLKSILIETDRMCLRHITREDGDSLFDLFADPVAMRYFPGTKTREETAIWIDTILTRYQTDGYGFYACVSKDTPDFLGYCGPLLQRDVHGRDEIEIGYGLLQKHWHNGYATEAARACMNYAYSCLGAKRIISLIRPENKASIRVAQRNNLFPETSIFRFGYNHLVYLGEPDRTPL